jgi:hypothetical protein
MSQITTRVSVRFEARPAFGEQARWKSSDLVSPCQHSRPATRCAGQTILEEEEYI